MRHPLSDLFAEYRLLLGSQSPRRRELLEALDVPFDTEVRKIEEEVHPEWPANEIAGHLAWQKAQAYPDLDERTLLLTADTVVVGPAQQVLLKPRNRQAALEALQHLAGQDHVVYSAFCLAHTGTHKVETTATIVRLKDLSTSLLEYYVDKCAPFDKAGAYGIQEWIGYALIEKIEGSYPAVMGLDTAKVFECLWSFQNLSTWNP